MITMDTVAIIIGVFGLLGGLVAFVIFVSQRPTRDEVNTTISTIVTPIASDVKYIRERIDQMPIRKTK